MRFTRTYFNDFIYAITIGSGLGEIPSFSINRIFICCAVFFAIVLEDFYSYKRWIDVDRALDNYGMPSLFIEFAILVAWFGALKHASAGESKDALAWLGVFWLIKFIAGVTYYIRLSGRERGIIPDTIWLIGAVVSFLFAWQEDSLSLGEVFYWWMCVGLGVFITLFFQISRRVLDLLEAKQAKLGLVK